MTAGTGSPLRMRTSQWTAMAFGAGLAAVVVYLYGLWAGDFLVLLPLSEYCVGKLADPGVSLTWFPLRHLCHWQDGTTSDLVPAYVNPLLIIFLVITVTGIVMAIRTALRKAAVPPNHHHVET
ncbi:hypothetical protein ACFOY2_15240 [Nonomuraea purpurea]|uniref:Transmembrane protein n=1 Tax=Nonomuraea purpurea TaxID=1849276 RepID=A0ABV8G630_9ACTN